jgi:hypothetical protein
MATYRQLLESCILGSETTNGAALALQVDPALVGAVLRRVAATGVIVEVDHHRWRLVPEHTYGEALETVERAGIVLDDHIA